MRKRRRRISRRSCKRDLWYTLSLDLFGGEVSSNAADAFAAGIKGRYKEDRYDEHKLVGSHFAMDVLEGGKVVHKDVAMRNALGNADTPMEYFYGRTWLEKDATAFDTLQIRAAMAYGLAPTGLDQIEFKTGSADDAALKRIKTPK